MLSPLRRMLSHVIRSGDITFIDARGASLRLGDGSGPSVVVSLADRSTELALLLDPGLAAGERYMDGRLQIKKGSLYDFVEIVQRNLAQRRYPPSSRGVPALRTLARRLARSNPPWRARRNVRHHYDIDSRLYDLFLDPDRQYSCAYFAATDDLAEAQLAKKRHIAAKLAVEPGMRVLDIGSGWGGLAIYLARTTGANVTGITLSEEQLAVSLVRAERENLATRIHFAPMDYREVAGGYDRVVSVGMFEHVGRAHFDTYFSSVARLLADDGVALIHTIGRLDGPAETNPFLLRHIFPGGYLPALSEIMPSIERSGLILTDVEVLRLHYAQTLRAWRQRFQSNRARAVEISGERFCRAWEFYLAGSEAAFRHGGLAVFQLQLEKRLGTLPITRDYMMDRERRLAWREAGQEKPRLAGE